MVWTFVVDDVQLVFDLLITHGSKFCMIGSGKYKYPRLVL